MIKEADINSFYKYLIIVSNGGVTVFASDHALF